MINQKLYTQRSNLSTHLSIILLQKLIFKNTDDKLFMYH